MGKVKIEDIKGVVGDRLIIKRMVNKVTESGIILLAADDIDPKPSGLVIKVGAKVTKIKEGDTIMYEPMTEMPLHDDYYFIRESDCI